MSLIHLFIKHCHPALKFVLPICDTFFADLELRLVCHSLGGDECVEQVLEAKHARGVGGQLGLDEVSEPAQPQDVVVEPLHGVGHPVVHDPLQPALPVRQLTKARRLYSLLPRKDFPDFLQKMRSSIVLIRFCCACDCIRVDVAKNSICFCFQNVGEASTNWIDFS